jgi:hypothetical protein
VYDILDVENGHRFVVYGTRPMVVSNCVQSAGHDLLLIWLNILTKMFTEEGIRFRPWLVDFHDEALVEIHNSDLIRAKEIMGTESFQRLNELCCKGSVVTLKGSGGVVASLAEAKCED